MDWDSDALKELEIVPEHVREMAKYGVEEIARKKGRTRVTVEDVKEGWQRYGSQFRKEDKATNIAVVRCEVVAEVCPGVGCLRAFFDRKELFEGYDENTKLLGFFTCGGCPGRRVFRLVNSLKRYGVSVVHLSSCVLMAETFPKCPHKEEMKQTIENLGVKVVEGTHHEVVERR